MSSGDDPRAGRRERPGRSGAAARPSSRASTSGAGAAASSPSASASTVARPERQLVVAGHDRRPAAVEQPADEPERVGHRQPRRRVERALPVELGPVAGRPPRRRRPRTAFAPCEIVFGRIPGWRSRRAWRNAGALRRADPLVEVAGVPGRAEPVEVERQHPRRVGAVDERLDPALGERGDDPLDREDQRRRARDVADQGEPGPVGDRAEDRVDDVVLRRDRERDPGDDDAGAVALGDVAQDVDRRVVLVVVGQELVAGLEPERADDGVDGAGRVRRRTPGRPGRRRRTRRASAARLGEEARQVAGEELDRLRLEPVAPAALGLEDGVAGTPRTSRGSGT